ncbi:aromatase/cyclase [Streptomyces sp. NPDC006283]|uniref:aromatase/cyclase n=1 Tax=Streptomyces sp. NPDC006283 TaxID=3156741 RepID=UPI0033B1DE22
MTAAGRRSAEYVATSQAPAQRAYRLIADVTRWPLLFTPCLHVEQLGAVPGGDRFRMWVAAGDQVRAWTSLRHADDEALRVTFRQERPSAPLSAAEGTWHFRPDTGPTTGTRITLTNAYTLLPSADEATAAFLAQALERHNADEVAAVRFWAERPEPLEDLLFTLTDEIVLDLGADTVFGLLRRHTGAHIALPGRRLVPTGLPAPAGLRAHTCVWSVVADGARSRVHIRHDAAWDPNTPAPARATVEERLRRSSLQILERAGAHAADRAKAR